MNSNPLLGVILHMVGGLASGSFYVPYRGVRKWSWESYWLAGGFFSWIIAPWLLAWLTTPHFLTILQRSWSEHRQAMIWCYVFGAMWGVGGLTFGLTMRYLGMSLGMAIALGYCAAFGTLMPPIVDGSIVKVLPTASGIITLIGVAVCLGGIAVTGMAGMSKEREMSHEEKTATIEEFSFLKGLLVATFSGIMSAGMAYGLTAGKPIADMAVEEYGTPEWFWKLPVLVVVLAGGFTSNFLWCVFLNLKNRSGGDYVNASTPLLRNYLFSALAGTTWYFQFFFYQMGEAKIGQYKFSSWSLHMASIIIFSTLWGIGLHEWRGSSRRTERLLTLGLAVLVVSLVIIGYGNYLKPAD
jgi:L-rhamnose-H+ transport protein